MFSRIVMSLAVVAAATVLGVPGRPLAASAQAATPDTAAEVPPSIAPGDVEFDRSASTDELLESAREMFLADNYVLAEMLYKAVLIREPNHLFAMQELAIVYEAMGKLQYAKGLLSRAAALKPYDQDIIDKNNRLAKKLSKSLSTEVDSLIAAGAFELALPKLSVLLTTQPENAELHFQKALCHLEMDDPVNALAAIDDAIALQNEPRYFDLRSRAQTLKLNREIGALAREVRRCMISGREADRESALVLVSRMLELDPDNEWAQRYFYALTTGEEINLAPASGDNPAVEIGAAAGKVGHTIDGAARVVTENLSRHVDALIYCLIALAVFASPLAFMIIRGHSPRHSLSGRLNQFNIQEVLAMIHSQDRTGILKIRSGGASGRVFFGSGEVYHCTCGRLEGREALRHLMARAVDGYFVFTKSKRSSRTTIDVPLSLILMDLPARDKPVVTKGLPKADKHASPKKHTRMKELLDSKR